MSGRIGVYAGHEWIEALLKARRGEAKMSQLGKDAADLLGELFYGIYHLDTKALAKVEWNNAHWIEFSLGHKNLATFDFDELTRLVFLAHHLSIRISIEASTHNYLKLTFHRRERIGGMSVRHPFLDDAVRSFKENVSLPEFESEAEVAA